MVHLTVLVGIIICFALMVGLTIFKLNTAWSYASNIIVIEQLFLFSFSIFYKSDILMEISYPISILIQTLGLFMINMILYKETISWTQYICLIMITIWSLRLSIYLILRISLKQTQNKQYSRFINLWENKLRLFTYLIFQYLTIFVNNFGSIAIFYFDLNVSVTDVSKKKDILWLNIVCTILFVLGMGISSVADYHKYNLEKQSIDKREIYKYSFLWRICRRINYGGDVLIFWSVWLLSINNILSSNNHILWVTIAGPIHVTLALLWFSNVFDKKKYLEALKNDTTNTEPNEYSMYKSKTPYFLPFVWIESELEPKSRIGWGLGMHQIAQKNWNID